MIETFSTVEVPKETGEYASTARYLTEALRARTCW